MAGPDPATHHVRVGGHEKFGARTRA